ncbi:hypothetical protein QCA50_001298 [Cerrena zonata]|uniref:Uncharacterized protein n=1 Tax=Cerrena zonata TaxID=2478898 RepID=A0AAW0H0M5_9APHY
MTYAKLAASVPLMRTPAAYSTVSWYCASCDSSKNTLNDTTDTTSSTSSASVNGSLDHVSRPSTPPTEVSSTFSSPVFAPVDTEEILRRRQQSDLASVEIGKRMLKGWAMLADECPNSECFGIPLVRPPKAGGGKDPRKECVICHTIWVNRPNGGPLARQDSSQSETTPIAGPSRQLNLDGNQQYKLCVRF